MRYRLGDTYFVYCEGLPPDLLKILTIFQYELISREEDVELQIAHRSELEFANYLAGLG